MSGARRRPVEISRAILVGQIAPALECPPRPRLDQNYFWVEHQMAPSHTRPIHQRTHVQKALPAQHVAANYPKERPVMAQLIESGKLTLEDVDEARKTLQKLAKQKEKP